MTSSNKTFLYVEPKLELLDSPSQVSIEKFSFSKEYLNFSELFSFDFLIITAEPGDGKSRLLKQIVIDSKQNNKKSIFIDLKRIEDGDIIEEIQNFIKRPNKPCNTNEEINNVRDYVYSEQFPLSDSNDIIICLDALDEVKGENVFSVIEKIKRFKHAFPKIRVIISCRDYIFRKYQPLFSELNAKVVQVSPFDRDDIERFLTAYKFTTDEFQTVIERFSKGFFGGFQIDIINSPRILEIFVSIKNKEGLANAIEKSKAELLEYFIYGELSEEEKKANKNQKEIIKRVLEKLALVMEIYQSNEITKDELMTFFDDINSNLSASFLQQISINYFYERALLVTTSDGEKIRFQNVEFQEYLAAKEITRLGRIDQVAFDLFVEKNLKELYSSWANSIKYLLELYPPLQLDVIEFICRRNNNQDFSLLDRFLITDSNIISKMQVDARDKIFSYIFSKYQTEKWYLPHALAEKLSLYVSKKVSLKIESYMNANAKDKGILSGNSLLMVNYLLEKDSLYNAPYWKNQFVEILKKKTSDQRLKKLAIRSISIFNDIGLLKDNFEYEGENEAVLYEFLWACLRVDPNDPFTINAIAESIKKDNINIAPRPSFDEINSLDGVKFLLAKLRDDHALLDKYINQSYEKFRSKSILKTIAQYYNDDIKKLLQEIFLLPDSYLYNENFVFKIISLIKGKDKNYIFELLDMLKSKNLYETNFFHYNQIFEILLTPETTDKFIEEVLKINNSRNPLLHFLHPFKYSDVQDRKKIFEISKKYFESDYEEAAVVSAECQARYDGTPAIYEQLKFKLEPEKGKFINNIFSFYASHKRELSPVMQPEDIERIKDLLINTVLIFDFSQAHFTITDNSSPSKSFSISSSIQIFADALPLFKEFELDQRLCRQKTLEYFPFAFQNHDDSKHIFDFLGVLTTSEIQSLIDFYQTPRTDDLFAVNIRNFFSVCKHYKIVQGIPIIKNVVLNQHVAMHEREEALDLINFLQPDFIFFKSVWKKYSSTHSHEQFTLANIANEYLIRADNIYKEKAIKWRMREIISNPLKVKSDNDSGFSDSRLEFKLGKQAKVLQEVIDIQFAPLYIKMLEGSIKIYNKGKEYRPYATHIWNTVMVYFDNLKSFKSFRPIQELELTISKYSRFFKGYALLYNHFSRIKTSYVNTLGKPDSFTDAINKYNELKEKKYLSIASPNDFYYLVKNIIETDIKKWVEKEGAYKFINKVKRQEDLIQKTIKTQFENCLLKKGLREEEVRIRREEQLLDDKRTDFIISYGFVGQILIEIKLTKNSEVNDKKYYKKLVQYIDGTKSDFGIFLIFQTDKRYTWNKLEPKIQKMYTHSSEKIKIIGLNCIK